MISSKFTMNIIKNFLFVLIFLTACSKNKNRIALPEGIPKHLSPPDNSFTEEKALLGRFLFYDRRLSGDETMSCASCHNPVLAFTDGKIRPRGIPDKKGQLGPRNTPNLTNTAYTKSYTWINPGLQILESQALVPLFLDNTTVEMGLASKDREAVEKIKQEGYYREMFANAFPGEDNPIHIGNIIKAIASFERTFISFNSPYDLYISGKKNALSPSAVNGKEIFFSKKANCSKCHSGKYFSDAQDDDRSQKEYFHNNGIHSLYTDSSGNEGLSEITLNIKDRGKFKTPTLRNVSVTYPYMHDGSITCDSAYQIKTGEYNSKCAEQALRRVIDHYSSSGKTRSNSEIKPVYLTYKEKEDLLQFLFSLTDESFLRNEYYQNPMPGNPNFGN